MTVEQIRVVDFISIETGSGNVKLTVSDHLEWETDTNEHFLVLQEKLNTYLAFVESGEILESYPDAKDRDVVIEIVCKYQPNERALKFLSKAATVIGGAGFELRHTVFSGT